MPYSLFAKFISETLATCFAIFIGSSTIANELLPSTKGHAQGYFSTGLGFTFAFFISGAWFGKISAEMNPAMFFYLVLRDKLEYGWLEFFVGSAGALLGAFLGACLTFFYWAAHFWTIPLPQDPDSVSRLINGPADSLSADAGRLASAFGSDSRPEPGTTFRDEAVAFGQQLIGGGGGSSARDGFHADSPDEEDNNQNQNNGQVTGELQGLLEQMEQERRTRSESLGSEFFNYNSSNSSNDAGMTSEYASTDSLPQLGSYLQETELQNSQTASPENPLPVNPATNQNQGHTYEFLKQNPVDNGTKGDAPKKKVKFLPKIPTVKLPDKAQLKRIKDKLHLSGKKKQKQKQKEALNAAFQAAIQADQAAKLTIFSTRPAKFNRFANFMQEMTSTFCLVFGIQMMNMRLEYDEVAKAITSPYTQGLYTTFFVISLILGLGGTTGFAVNPARDLGPRIAHALLPIPGKGDSEWYYGWIPVFAPFVGAALAALAMEGMEALYESGMD